MATLLSHKTIKSARKAFACDGCFTLLHYGSFDQFIEEFNPTPEELEAINRARESNFRIKVGEPYIKQFIVDGGDRWTFRSIPEIYEIGIKYGFYEND